MEAPKKIYLHPDIGGKEFIRPWLHKAANSESVEYIRKDVFIKKALKWMTTKECINDLLSVEMIDEFKTYMEEE